MFLLSSMALARTWIVDATGGGDYVSVQAAVEAASDGDILEVAAGVYLEGVTLGGKALSIEGAGSTVTTIGAPGVPLCLDLRAGEVLSVSGVAFSACDTLVAADAATLAWSDVALWGAEDAGTLVDTALTWEGGELTYLYGGLTFEGGTVVASDLELVSNESDTPLLAFDGGTGGLTRLTATGNVLTDAVLSVEGGAAVTLDAPSFSGNEAPWLAYVLEATLDSVGGTWASDSGEMIRTSLPGSALNLAGDVFTTAGTALALYGYGCDGMYVEGATFVGYTIDTTPLIDQCGASVLVGLSGAGTYDIYGELRDSVLEGARVRIGDGPVVETTLRGGGGTAFDAWWTTGSVSLERVTVEGYDYAVDGTFVVTESSFTAIGTYSTNASDVDLTDSTLETTGDGIVFEGASLTLVRVSIDAGGDGLDVDTTLATLEDVSIVAGDTGLRHRDRTLVASGVDIEAGGQGVILGDSASARPDATFATLRVEAGGDGLVVMRDATATVSLADLTIDAGGDAITVAADATATILLETASITASTGFAGDGCFWFEAEGLTLVADEGSTNTCFYPSFVDSALSFVGEGILGRDVIADRLVVDAGGAAFSVWSMTGTDIAILGGSCLLASRGATLDGFTCTAEGDRPLDLTASVSLTDATIASSVTTGASRFVSATVVLDDVAFVDNTTADGPGALELSDCATTATGLYAEGNSGPTAGALSIDGGSAVLSASIFRANESSSGPGAALDGVGATWECALFQGNSGEAGDLELTAIGATLDNATFVGSTARATGAIHVNAGYVLLRDSLVTYTDGAGVYGDAAVRTTYHVYDDVYANTGGAYAGGLADPTGTSGNLAADPLYVAWTDDGDWTNDDLTLGAGSPGIDAGYPTGLDPDGSVADLGALAPGCPELDLDGDHVRSSDGDCDDRDSTVAPGLAEICDGVDQDCDGDVDEDPSFTPAWYPDADGDGFGVETGAVAACEAPAGYAAQAGDCDDADASVYPSAPEDCSGSTDANCDGLFGTGDADGDAWAACEDCDDTRADVYPGAAEECDGADEDCDGLVDDGASDATTRYRDADGDTYGDSATAEIACAIPDGYSEVGGDCDDADGTIHPSAPESCSDTVDTNCDGSVGFEDADVDGWTACEECDDGNPAVHPEAEEVCNETDDDCDGDIDEDAVDAPTWYRDADGDGYGAAGVVKEACVAPDGFIANAGDCDDGDAGTHPGASEDCLGLGEADRNCDGYTGEEDNDRDGVRACDDCDDGDPSVSPGAQEVCDGLDNDCDAEIDEDSSVQCYPDEDGDGWGTGEAVVWCTCGEGWAEVAGDCDDADRAVRPGAGDVPDDGTDADCDGYDPKGEPAPEGCGCGGGGGASPFLVLFALVAIRRAEAWRASGR